MDTSIGSRCHCLSLSIVLSKSYGVLAQITDVVDNKRDFAALCSKVQHLQINHMPTNKQRLSINLSVVEYAELSALAERNNLSMAWIGHKAVLEFLALARTESLQLPLAFSKQREPELTLGVPGPSQR